MRQIEINTYKLREFNIIASIAFVVNLALCFIFGWFDLVDYLLTDIQSNRAQEFILQPRYIITCTVFMALVVVLPIVGCTIRSKCMVFLSVGYQFVLILAFVLLAVFVNGSVTSDQSTYSALVYCLTAVLIPVYGLIWEIGPLFFLIIIPLVIFSVVAIVMVLSKKKQ